jgi:hypothetical protein
MQDSSVITVTRLRRGEQIIFAFAEASTSSLSLVNHLVLYILAVPLTVGA